jgi:hypothetical protein
MRIGARLASVKFTLLPRSGSTSRTLNSEYLLRAEFFGHTNLHVQKVVNYTSSGKPIRTVYAFVTTDMGRFCRKPMISALFICKPPL